MPFFCEESYGEGNEREYYALLSELPQDEQTASFLLSCSWGGQEVSRIYTVHFISRDLPTGFSNVPNEIVAYVGDTISIQAVFEPADWESEEIIPNYFWEGTDAFSEGIDTLTMTQSGEYIATYNIAIDSVILSQEVRFIISEKPQEPEWALTLPLSVRTIEQEAFMNSFWMY